MGRALITEWTKRDRNGRKGRPFDAKWILEEASVPRPRGPARLLVFPIARATLDAQVAV